MRSPHEYSYIRGYVTALHSLWLKGQVETSDHIIALMREEGFTVEDMKEADVDVRVYEDLKGRGAPYRQT